LRPFDFERTWVRAFMVIKVCGVRVVDVQQAGCGYVDAL